MVKVNIISFFFLSYVLVLLLEVCGIDNKRSIAILINEKSNKNKNKKKLNESFVLLENKNSDEKLLSRNKTTSQTSTYRHINRVAGSNLAVDGNKNTDFWKGSCSLTNIHNYPRWLVDLSNYYVISRVEVTHFINGNHIQRNLNIMVTNSTSDITLDKRCGKEIDVGPGHTISVNCANKIGRYVIVFVNRVKTSLDLCEVEVYGKDLCTAGMHQCNPKNTICTYDEKIIPTGYRCDCLKGYKKDTNNINQCIDINECETNENNCNKNNTECINLDGSYRCEIIKNISDMSRSNLTLPSLNNNNNTNNDTYKNSIHITVQI